MPKTPFRTLQFFGGWPIFSPHHGGREKAEKLGVGRISGLHPWGRETGRNGHFPRSPWGPIHWENRVSARHLLGRCRRVQKPLTWIAFGTLQKIRSWPSPKPLGQQIEAGILGADGALCGPGNPDVAAHPCRAWPCTPRCPCWRI